MDAADFFSFYKALPTKADQKQLRHRILQRGKINKMTFYSWIERQAIPDAKALANIEAVCEEYKQLNLQSHE
jgi:hypothetical protein